MPPYLQPVDETSNSSISRLQHTEEKKGPVRFDDAVVTREIQKLDSGLNENGSWYTADEYNMIFERDSLIIEIWKAGSFQEKDEQTFRGLESHLLDDNRTRARAIVSVLNVQKIQKARRMHNPDRIADTYMKASASAIEKALRLGQLDAAAVGNPADEGLMQYLQNNEGKELVQEENAVISNSAEAPDRRQMFRMWSVKQLNCKAISKKEFQDDLENRAKAEMEDTQVNVEESPPTIPQNRRRDDKWRSGRLFRMSSLKRLKQDSVAECREVSDERQSPRRKQARRWSYIANISC